MTTAQLALALAALFPSLLRARVDVDDVARALVASAERHDVRPALLAAVGWRESRLGTDPGLAAVTHGRGAFGLRPGGLAALCRQGRARCEGTPLAQQADGAAAVLAEGRRRCRTERGALRYFHHGGCGHHRRPYDQDTLRLAARIERAAGVGRRR